MNTLNKDILKLSIPSIVANITVPLVGIVDTAIAGHLGGGAAVSIAAISIGSMLFTLLYWGFGFLRTGTGGLCAQCYGAKDWEGCASILWRALSLSVAIAAVLLLIQWPFLKLSMLCTQASAEVEALAARYFFIRIWAAPATLSLMGFSGWFVGMQDSVSSMWKDLIVNGVNVAASIILAKGIGSWEGMGFDGIAAGTVIAQYCGLAYCIIVSRVKYRKVLSGFSLKTIIATLHSSELHSFLKLNGNLFLRSLFFISIYIGYTLIASSFGDVLLACSSVMMELLLIFSYFTDGFAYAGEALVGRFIGAKDKRNVKRAVRYVFVWSMSIAVAFIGIYAVTGEPLLRLMTSDATVIGMCRNFLPWLMVMPPLGCAAFTWDGVYLGATASVQIRDAMFVAMVAFIGAWFAGKVLFLQGVTESVLCLHLLLAAYFIHLVARTVMLSFSWKKVYRSLPDSAEENC